MSGGGNSGASGGGTGGTTTPSYQGGGAPDTFDPKNFGTTLLSDMSRIYQQGPKVNPYSDYVPYSGATSNLLNQGVGDAGRERSMYGSFAGGAVGSQNPFYLSGPDFNKGFVGDLAGGRVDLGNNYDTGNLGRIGQGGTIGNNYDTGNLGRIGQGGVSVGNDYQSGILGDVAKGKYLGKGNPFLNAEIKRTNNDVSNDVNSTFASNGRFGSDIHATGLSTGLANSENTARFNQYNTDYGNMTQALGLQDQAAGRNLDRQLQVKGLQDQSAQRNLGNQLDILGRQDSSRMRDVNGRLQGLGLQTQQAADRRNQYNTEYDRRMGAMDRMDAATARGLGYSGMLDSKMREKNAADRGQWDATNNADYNQIAKYLGLLRGGDTSNETNKPTSIWDILGGIGNFAGNFF